MAWRERVCVLHQTDLCSDPGSATSCVALDTLLNLSGLHFFTSPVGIAPPSLLGGWADSVDWCQSACWTAKTPVESLLPDFSVPKSWTRPQSRGWGCWPCCWLLGHAVSFSTPSTATPLSSLGDWFLISGERRREAASIHHL